MIKVKICGITNIEDALAAVEYGADAIGFNFFRRSPRCIDPEDARSIALEIPSSVWRVGVFADAPAESVKEICQMVGLDYLQFHGDETPYYCEQFAVPYWKAFRPKNFHSLDLLAKYDAAAYLIDTYQPGVLGGTGQKGNWSLAIEAKKYGKIILAGGLKPENIENAVTVVQPWGVDVCSGIENEPGTKDLDRMARFIEIAKSRGDS